MPCKLGDPGEERAATTDVPAEGLVSSKLGDPGKERPTTPGVFAEALAQ